MRLTKRYYLECAHQLSGLRPNHKCMRLHGHNYMVDLTVVPKTKAEKAGEDWEVMKDGMVIDVGELDIVVAPMRLARAANSRSLETRVTRRAALESARISSIRSSASSQFPGPSITMPPLRSVETR